MIMMTEPTDKILSRPAWGAWIEIMSVWRLAPILPSRAPHGARGLKYGLVPAHGYTLLGRAPHGARGLKSELRHHGDGIIRRAPHGARGLKCLNQWISTKDVGSRPAWGAWIEIWRS